jgi:hypothetical protein
MLPTVERPSHSLGDHHEGRFVALFVLTLIFHVALPIVRDFERLTVIIGLSFVAVLGYAAGSRSIVAECAAGTLA